MTGVEFLVHATTYPALVARDMNLFLNCPLPQSLQLRHRNIEPCGVHHTLTLKLHPYAIGPCARKDDVELHLRPAVSDEGMIVNHVDQFIARRQHVAPGAEIELQSIGRFEM